MTALHTFSNRLDYTRAERISHAVVHGVALVAALMAVPVLVTLAVVWRGDAASVAGVSIYGATLIAMILCSALYNGVTTEIWGSLLQRLDHTAIFFKIAGTFTPFSMLSGGQGGWVLAGVWGLAFAGAGLRSFGGPRWKWTTFGLYLAMGWVGTALGWPLMTHLSVAVVALIVAGGLLYTAGTVFLIWDRLPFHNTIWHLFVMVATTIFFAAIVLHLAQTSAAWVAEVQADTAP